MRVALRDLVDATLIRAGLLDGAVPSKASDLRASEGGDLLPVA
jgi:hypothetical protein